MTECFLHTSQVKPVVSGSQLKCSGQNVIKLAAPEAIKPPRTSPLVSTTVGIDTTRAAASPQASHVTSTTTPDSPRTSSPQTRKLVAPESLRRPQTPPMVNRQHSSSPRRSRKLVAPQSLRPTSTPPLVRSAETGSPVVSTAPPHTDGEYESAKALQRMSVESHAAASPHTKQVEPSVELSESEISAENRQSIEMLKAPASLIGDGWLETHSGAGSQVSLCSQSPKPQSVQRFVVDLDDTSQSQTSEVDCSYISPSKEAESVFVTSDFLYVSPPSSDFKSDSSRSTNGEDENGDKREDAEQQLSVAERKLAFERKGPSKNNGRNGEARKPAKHPPAIPKRSSSISIASDQSEPTSRKTSTDSTNPLKEDSIVEEVYKPPPPPMSTHPGLASKTELDEDTQQEMSEEKSPSEDELPETSEKARPKPKARRVSIPAVKPEDAKDTHGSDSCDLRGSDRDRPAAPESLVTQTEVVSPDVIKEEDETNLTSLSAPLLDRSSTERSNKIGISENNTKSREDGGDETVIEATDYELEVSSSTGMFGHTTLTASTPEFPLGASSEEPLEARGSAIEDIDPSKKMGADVSTFKPIPKPRSFYRHSMYSAGTSGNNQPSISLSPPPEDPASTSRFSPPPLGYSLTPEMKRSSIHYPSPANKREMILRAQSMSMLPNSGSASPRMMVRGEQRSQMPPGFVVFSRSQEAVIGRHPTLSASDMLRKLRERENADSAGDAAAGEKGGKKNSAPKTAAAPMNTKRGTSTKKRRSIFRRK